MNDKNVERIKYRMVIFFLTFFLFLIFSPINVGAATDYYINRNCANNGNGSSWSCASGAGGVGAFNNIPADISCVFNGYSWVRGATYWVAGSDTPYGTGCLRLNNGTGRITLKKASEAEHGTDTGWLAEYGTKQAVLDRLSIWVSNVTIDGSYRASPESGYGFKIESAGTNNLISSPNNAITTGNIFKFIELTHTSYNTSGANAISLYGNGNNTIQYVYTHNLSGLCFKGNFDPTYHSSSGLANSIIEESVCGAIGKTTGTGHTELLKDDGAATNLVIKNNLFYDWKSTGGIVLSSGQSNWQIFNNIFSQRTAGLTCGNGVITGLTAGSGWTGIKVYNNTFANISSSCSNIFGSGFGNFSGAGNEVKNNLFYNVSTLANICGGGCTKSNNWFSITPGYTLSGNDISGSGNPFINSSSEDFSLAENSGPIDLGLNLESPYSSDKNGVTRPQGSGWDIGAYEYLASVSYSTPYATPYSTPYASPYATPSDESGGDEEVGGDEPGEDSYTTPSSGGGGGGGSASLTEETKQALIIQIMLQIIELLTQLIIKLKSGAAAVVSALSGWGIK